VRYVGWLSDDLLRGRLPGPAQLNPNCNFNLELFKLKIDTVVISGFGNIHIDFGFSMPF